MDINNLLQKPGIEREVNSRIGKLNDFKQLYGGSNRKFYRLTGTRNRSLILLYDDNSRMLDRTVQISKYLNSFANLAPKIYQNFWEHHIVLMQDLGDLSLEVLYKNCDDRLSVYERAIDMLILLQSSIYREEPPVIVKKTVFGYEKLLGETEQFVEYFIDKYNDKKQTNLSNLHSEFDKLALLIAEQPKVYMHRDLQSKNILIHDDIFKVIDLQEGCIGPYTYDLAALLMDPYIMLPKDIYEKLLEIYFQKIERLGFVDIIYDTFQRDFQRSAISRLMQALAAFERLSLSGKDEFSQYIKPGFSRLFSLVDDKEFPILFDLLRTLSPEIIV
ncbi:MAG: aminoglycoside phosphotransferase family protein [Candidatus Zixiibacteriota bacterium]